MVPHLPGFSVSFVGALCSQGKIEPVLGLLTSPFLGGTTVAIQLCGAQGPGGSHIPLPAKPQEHLLEVLSPLQPGFFQAGRQHVPKVFPSHPCSVPGK